VPSVVRVKYGKNLIGELVFKSKDGASAIDTPCSLSHLKFVGPKTLDSVKNSVAIPCTPQTVVEKESACNIYVSRVANDLCTRVEDSVKNRIVHTDCNPSSILFEQSDVTVKDDKNLIGDLVIKCKDGVSAADTPCSTPDLKFVVPKTLNTTENSIDTLCTPQPVAFYYGGLTSDSAKNAIDTLSMQQLLTFKDGMTLDSVKNSIDISSRPPHVAFNDAKTLDSSRSSVAILCTPQHVTLKRVMTLDSVKKSVDTSYTPRRVTLKRVNTLDTVKNSTDTPDTPRRVTLKHVKTLDTVSNSIDIPSSPHHTTFNEVTTQDTVKDLVRMFTLKQGEYYWFIYILYCCIRYYRFHPLR